MNRLSLIASASAVAVLLTTGAAAVPMNAKTVEYVVRNATGLDAEDLEFNFLEEGISTGQSRSFRNFFTTPDTSGITFNSGKVINGAQDTGAITFKTKGPYTLASAFWSFPGPQQQPIQIPLRNVTIDGGKKLSAASPTGLQGYMVIGNADPTATLFITLLGLAIDIPIALYDPADPTFQDNLRIPDGTAVSGFDTMFSLGPGEVRDFDLGPVNATDYEAMQFLVSASSFCTEISDTCSILGLASDVTLPEPGTLSIFAIALAGAWLLQRARRRSGI